MSKVHFVVKKVPDCKKEQSVPSFKKALNIFAIMVLVAVGLNFPPSGASKANDNDKVTICHATNSNSNPYNKENPKKDADVSGHDGHNGPVWFSGIKGDWGDIIPPFTYHDKNGNHSYPGKNWTVEGQAFYNNNCDKPAPVKGTITIVKDTIGGDGTFGFTATATSTMPGSFSLTTQNLTASTTFSNLDQGTYVITESPASGFGFTSLACDLNTAIVNSSTATITLGAGDHATCTFTNTKKGSITVVKNTVPTSDTNSFNFASNSLSPSEFILSNGGHRTFNNLLPGSYDVSEEANSNYTTTAICDNQDNPS